VKSTEARSVPAVPPCEMATRGSQIAFGHPGASQCHGASLIVDVQILMRISQKACLFGCTVTWRGAV